MITSSDRSTLIRLAASLPKGDEGRKAILAGLRYDFGTPEGDAEIDASEMRGVLKALSGAFTYQVRPNVLRYITYQPRKSGGVLTRLDLEDQDSMIGNMTTSLNERESQMWGKVSLDEVLQVLMENGAKLRKRQPPRPRPMPSYYD